MEEIPGMNIIMSSSIVLFLIYHYSLTYELEYSLYVMILTYELDYSLHVMRLAYMTLCLIIHKINMIRGRVKLRWWFIMPSGVLKPDTCQSVGLESWVDLSILFIHQRGSWGMDRSMSAWPFPRMRGKRQVVTTLSVLRNPPRTRGCRSLNCCGRTT